MSLLASKRNRSDQSKRCNKSAKPKSAQPSIYTYTHARFSIHRYVLSLIRMLHCDKIQYIYRRSNEGLANVNLDLVPGHFYGLLGKNGAGKTTLLRILSSLLFPQQGTCSINDIPVQKRSPEVLQDFYSFPEDLPQLALTGLQFLQRYAPFYPKFDTEHFHSLVDELDIRSSCKELLSKVSLGQRKKLYLAFALATRVSILLFDEPTNGLDIPSRIAVKSIIHQNSVQNKQIVLISTHNIKDIEDLVDHYVFIDQGTCLADISTKDMFSRFSLRVHQRPSMRSALHLSLIHI